ncbi:hypothetical protein [Bacillus manliponensis]|uniref:hypothetical protein n=1 Tax=Bacillus manliponensis TaxID=574376 RepID=UPI00351192BA
MSILAEYRWAFLIGAEIIFWCSVMSFFLLRYMFKLKKASFIAGIVLLLNEIFILSLGIIDYLETGKFSQFQIIIVIILLYAIFYGKKDLRKLDFFIQKQVAKWRGEEIQTSEAPVELTGWAHTKEELKGWGIHVLLFVSVHIVFFFLYGFIPVAEWSNWLETGIVQNKEMSRISQIWGIVFLVDTVIAFSYVIFPKKEKGKGLFS